MPTAPPPPSASPDPRERGDTPVSFLSRAVPLSLALERTSVLAPWGYAPSPGDTLAVLLSWGCLWGRAPQNRPPRSSAPAPSTEASPQARPSGQLLPLLFSPSRVGSIPFFWGGLSIFPLMYPTYG